MEREACKDKKTFLCTICGLSKTSKFALKRHKKNEHSAGVLSLGIVSVPVIRSSATVSDSNMNAVDCTLASKPCEGTTVADTRTIVKSVTAKKASRIRTMFSSGRQAALSRNRNVIDSSVQWLMKRHQTDPFTLSASSDELAWKLQQRLQQYKLPREVFLGVVVAAKHFAGTARPKAVAGRELAKKPTG